MKIKSLCSILMLCALCASAQTNAPSMPPLNATDLALANPAVAQAAGQQVLDAVPGFSILTNLPTTTFDQAKFEISLGLENTGATIQNLIAVRYDFATNFFAGGQLTLGSGSTVMNSVGINAGLRHAWANSEVYGGLAGIRNWQTGLDTWEGEAFAGYAYKPSSGFAVFGQLETFVTKSTKAPALGYVCGVLFPF